MTIAAYHGELAQVGLSSTDSYMACHPMAAQQSCGGLTGADVTGYRNKVCAGEVMGVLCGDTR
jgi:hypothetical protein